MTVCHVWPGLTPFSVWHLPFHVWHRFALAADAWQEERSKQHG